MDAVDNFESRPIRQWIITADEHAKVHLTIYDSALALLLDPSVSSANPKLAEDCERWRYQVLKERQGQLTAVETALTNLLDLAANKAAKRQPRRARGIREVIESTLPPRFLRGYQPFRKPIRRERLETTDTRRQLLEAARQITLQTFADVDSGPHDSGPHTEEQARSESNKPGRVISLFAPIYLTNHCVNPCPYCWFRYSEPILRRSLAVDEVIREASLLRKQGVKDILLVAGDYPRLIKSAYLAQLSRELRAEGFTVKIEIAPQSTAIYAELADTGIDGVTIYQETYDRQRYASCHPRGRKSAYDWRLETLDRAAEAGIKHLGLGILLGLAEPIKDLICLIAHGQYLLRRFPTARLALSLPRLRHAPSDFQIPYYVDDDLLVCFYSLLRLFFPTAHIVLSTRESVAFRNRLIPICISRISAGSKTSPGGYGDAGKSEHAGEQFPISDNRSIEEIAKWLHLRNLTINSG